MIRHLGTAALAIVLMAAPALAAPGDPVVGYGDDGFVIIPPDNELSVAPGELVIAPNGTAVLEVGAGDVDFGLSPAVIAPDGSWVRLDTPPETCSASRTALAADGSVFFAGQCENGSQIVRYNPDFTIDADWGDASTPGVFNHPELNERTLLTVDGPTVLYLAGPDRTIVGRDFDGTVVGSFPIDPLLGPQLAPSPLAILPGTGPEYHVVGFTDATTLGLVTGTLAGTISMATTIPLPGEWGVADASLTRNGDLIIAYTERTAVGDDLRLVRIGPSGELVASFVNELLEIPAFVEHLAVAELRTGDIAVLATDGDLGNHLERFSSLGTHLGELVDWIDLPAGPSGFFDMAVSPHDGDLFFSRAVPDLGNPRAEVWRFEGDASGRFVDDDGSVFETAIEQIASTSITKGCNPPANDYFCPTDAVTRGQMAAFLSRAFDLPDPAIGNTFSDDDGSVFETDIEKLAAAGITRGCNPPDNDRFCPDDLVTRGQMAALLVRALNLTDRGSVEFSDDDGSVFESDIEKLATAGITLGCNPPANDRYCPNDMVSRGQMAAFLTRAGG